MYIVDAPSFGKSSKNKSDVLIRFGYVHFGRFHMICDPCTIHYVDWIDFIVSYDMTQFLGQCHTNVYALRALSQNIYNLMWLGKCIQILFRWRFAVCSQRFDFRCCFLDWTLDARTQEDTGWHYMCVCVSVLYVGLTFHWFRVSSAFSNSLRNSGSAFRTNRSN